MEVEGHNLIKELLNEEKCNSIQSILDRLNIYFSEKDIKQPQILTSELISKELFEEIKNISENISVYFGKTLRDIKCTIMDEEGLREHEIYLRYKSNNKLSIANVKLPYSSYQDRDYSSISEVITVHQNYIKSLAAYFQELDNIDQNCTVVEPVEPTYKDNYRRILLDGRTWLHIEVTPDGSAQNIHLIRQSEQLYDKLHKGLLNWDHDKNIVENIKCIFDIENLSEKQVNITEQVDNPSKTPSCNICFCVNLAECQGLPQPLCQNTACEAYYHKTCLFQWLVACEGDRPPAFGVAYGSCPTCLQPITCSEN